MWDTFSLFKGMLDDFPKCLTEATLLQSDNEEDVYPIKLAIIGFSRFMPIEEWSYSQYQTIRGFLDGDLADLSWFEDGAKQLDRFPAYAWELC